MFSQWYGLLEIIHRYWQNYGGLASIIKSPYFHLAFIFTIITIPFWFYKEWWSNSMTIIPSILGFTLGGFAIFLGYGNDKFRSLLAIEDKAGKSPYLEVVSSFLHFVLMQMIALIFALFANAVGSISIMNITETERYLGISLVWFILGFIGYGLFIYSLLLAFAVSFALYRLANTYTKFETQQARKNNTE